MRAPPIPQSVTNASPGTAQARLASQAGPSMPNTPSMPFIRPKRGCRNQSQIEAAATMGVTDGRYRTVRKNDLKRIWRWSNSASASEPSWPSGTSSAR